MATCHKIIRCFEVDGHVAGRDSVKTCSFDRPREQPGPPGALILRLIGGELRRGAHVSGLVEHAHLRALEVV